MDQYIKGINRSIKRNNFNPSSFHNSQNYVKLRSKSKYQKISTQNPISPQSVSKNQFNKTKNINQSIKNQYNSSKEEDKSLLKNNNLKSTKQIKAKRVAIKNDQNSQKDMHIKNYKKDKLKFNQRHKTFNTYLNHLEGAKASQDKTNFTLKQNQFNGAKIKRIQNSIQKKPVDNKFYGVIAQYRRRRIDSIYSKTSNKTNQSVECSINQPYKINLKKKLLNPIKKYEKSKSVDQFNDKNKYNMFTYRRNRIASTNSVKSSSKSHSISDLFQQKVRLMKQHLKMRKNSLQNYKKSFQMLKYPKKLFFQIKDQNSSEKQSSMNQQSFSQTAQLNKQQKIKQIKSSNTKQNQQNNGTTKYSYEQLHLQLKQYKDLFQKELKKNQKIQKQLQTQKKKNNLSKQLYKSQIQKLRRNKNHNLSYLQNLQSNPHQVQNQYKVQNKQLQQRENIKTTNNSNNFQELKQKLKNNHLYTYKTYQHFLSPPQTKTKKLNSIQLHQQNFGNGASILNVDSNQVLNNNSLNNHNLSHDIIVQLSDQIKPSSYFNSTLAKSKANSMNPFEDQNSYLLKYKESLIDNLKGQTQYGGRLSPSEINNDEINNQKVLLNQKESIQNQRLVTFNKISNQLNDKQIKETQKQESLLLDISSNLNYTITQNGQLQNSNSKTINLFSFCQNPLHQNPTIESIQYEQLLFKKSQFKQIGFQDQIKNDSIKLKQKIRTIQAQNLNQTIRQSTKQNINQNMNKGEKVIFFINKIQFSQKQNSKAIKNLNSSSKLNSSSQSKNKKIKQSQQNSKFKSNPDQARKTSPIQGSSGICPLQQKGKKPNIVKKQPQLNKKFTQDSSSKYIPYYQSQCQSQQSCQNIILKSKCDKKKDNKNFYL